MNEPPRPCPICGSDTGFVVYLRHLGRCWVQCRSCGGGHLTPYLPELEDDSLMEESGYEAVYLQPAFFARRLAFARNQAQWLAEHYRHDMVVVEIGPGLGLAAEAFLARFPEASYHMIEPHGWFADFIADRLGTRVCLHRQASVDALSTVLAGIGARPVLLYLDNVLEHVAGPRAMLADIQSRVPRGSVALIDVPNEYGLKGRHRVYTAIGAETTVRPNHINLFTKRAFAMMLDGLGLRYDIRQRGIRRREEVNCLPEGPALDIVLRLLRLVPIDTMLGLGNNLRVAIYFK
jgi:hypothetical protein